MSKSLHKCLCLCCLVWFYHQVFAWSLICDMYIWQMSTCHMSCHMYAHKMISCGERVRTIQSVSHKSRLHEWYYSNVVVIMLYRMQIVSLVILLDTPVCIIWSCTPNPDMVILRVLPQYQVLDATERQVLKKENGWKLLRNTTTSVRYITCTWCPSGLRQNFVDFYLNVLMSACFCSGSSKSGWIS